MRKKEKRSNADLITRYTDQPARMPDQLREKIEKHWNNRPIQLYAIADLDARMQLTTQWIALGEKSLAIVTSDDQGCELIRNIQLLEIQSVVESPGLSNTTLSLLGAPGDPPFAVIRYTQRQRRAMENIKFLIEHHIEGNDLAQEEDPDELYTKAVTSSIRKAQASVAVNKLAVVWRLVAYLKPYKARLAFGMGSMVILTLVSLLPAYLTGYLIDNILPN